MARRSIVFVFLVGGAWLGCSGANEPRTGTRTLTLNLADFTQAPVTRFELLAASAPTQWCADVSGGPDTAVVSGCAVNADSLTLQVPAARCVEAAVDANADGIADARARQCDGNDSLDVAVYVLNDDPNWVPPLIEASPRVVRAEEQVTASFSGTFTAPVPVQLQLQMHRDGSWPYWRSATETVAGDVERSFSFKVGKDWPATNADDGSAYYLVLQVGDRIIGGPAVVVLTDLGGAAPAKEQLTNVAITINGGATIVTEPIVTLSLTAPGAAYYRTGLTADLGGVAWRPMTDQATFTLPKVSGDYVVYVQFATERGALSKTIQAGIRLVYEQSGSWVSVAAGTWHTCAIDVAGLLWCWGRNTDGELGVNAPNSVASPVRVADDSWLQISASSHTCGIRSDHSLWCWGSANTESQLGTGGGAANAPVRVGMGNDWKSVAAAQFHSCALKLDGSLWCWGQNSEGELGIGVAGNKSTPVRVGADNDWSQLDAKGSRTCAVKTSGALWCWGRNVLGQLGVGNTSAAWSPVQVTSTTWKRVALSHNTSCGLRNDDTLWCWGSNLDGQLGLGTTSGPETCPGPTACSTVPRQVAGAWRDVSSGSDGYDGEHLCGVRTGGDLHCWGANMFGELGIGNNVPASSPATTSSSPSWEAVVKGANHACALHNDGALYCWGESADGALGLGALTSSPVPKQVLLKMD